MARSAGRLSDVGATVVPVVGGARGPRARATGHGRGGMPRRRVCYGRLLDDCECNRETGGFTQNTPVTAQRAATTACNMYMYRYVLRKRST